ncbi:hypothetical protein ACOKFD_17410 [Flagellimonas sp. S174]|uniref:hypothetical protein n=1 Tax=Flagellimonas sp. S174 TaxID=3410790 RepID=UPI003BF4666C
MKNVIDTPFYREAFQELNYPFGDFYLFDHFIISEIKEDVVFTWEHHAKQVVNDISNLYENDGTDLIYISNRIHNYAVVPSDWIKFFRHNYNLKSYVVVAQVKNSLLERLFMGKKLKTFHDIENAIVWAKAKGCSQDYTQKISA